MNNGKTQCDQLAEHGEIKLIVPCAPVAQPRQRHRSVTTKAGRTFQQNYMPKTVGTGLDRKPHPVLVLKDATKMAFENAYKGPPMIGPVRVDVTLVFPRPASMRWKRRPMPRKFHMSKPDRDNCDKAILDALNGLAFVDDSQVCAGYVEKWIAAGDEPPHVEITIRPL